MEIRPAYQFQPQERAAAMKAGLITYFTGRPCKYGHVEQRRTSSGVCVVCEAAKSKKWAEQNPEKMAEVYKKSYAKHADKKRLYSKNYRAANPERVKENNKKSIQNRKPQRAASQMLRTARKLQATPAWLSKEQLSWISEYYVAAKQFGVTLAIDHIVPLRGENVCGLHVPWNLCLRTKSDNSKKHNKLTEEAYLPKQVGILVAESALPWNISKEF
jgi:hypothetical protein